jgi:predicted permease
MVRELLRRLHHLLHRRRFDAELREEMELHREMAARAGGPPLGDTLRFREDARDAWGFGWLDRLSQDLRFAFRTMRSSPGFTASAVLVLAVGIGATVAAFSSFNLALLRPLPVPSPQEILRFQRQGPDQYWTDVPYPAVAFYREHARTLSVFSSTTARLSAEGDEKPADAFFVTGNFLAELGATPLLGRIFTIGDEAPASPPMVVLHHRFWTSRFGADPGVVGKDIRLNGKAAVVVGVVTPEFSGLGGDAPELWALAQQHPYFVQGSPLLTDFSGQRNPGTTNMWGRLRTGVTAPAAEGELMALAAALRRTHPDDVWEGERLRAEPGGYLQSVGSKARGSGPAPRLQTRLYPVFAIVGVLVLLILVVACGNLGSLLLARGASRQREIALRVALGAGRWRLVRQLLTESLALALLGSGAGLALGALVTKAVLVWTEAPAWIDSTPDWRVLTFAIGIGGTSALLFGLSPALYVARQRTGRSRGRSVMIAGQVAASCVLLIVAGLLLRAFDRASSQDPGFDYHQTVLIEPALLQHGYRSARARLYLGELEQRLRALPGVEAVALAATPPLGGARTTTALLVNGRQLEVDVHRVDPAFFATLRIPLLRGRGLRTEEPAGVVVSEPLARRRWPGEEPLGKTLELDGDTVLTVVGVAASARSLALRDPDAVELYRVVTENDLGGVSVLVRTRGTPEAAAAAMGAAARAIDPDLRPRVSLLKHLYRDRIRDVERAAVAVGLLGTIALLVACLGVVGLVAYAVAQRTKEIGIRLALGAGRHHILRSVAGQFLPTVAVGLVGGIAGAAALAQLLRRQLYGVSALDPVSYGAAVCLFALAAGLAGLLPARRALRVDPSVALRCD